MNKGTLFFLDESGDPSADIQDPNYPVFTLACVTVEREDYVRHVVPSLAELKVRHWGHEGVILHGIAIRRQENEFSVLRDAATRLAFHERLGELMRSLPFRVALAIVDKRSRRGAEDLYPMAWRSCLRQLGPHLAENRGATIWVESRGKREDAEFRRASGDPRLRFVGGSANLAGLQLADLCAYPAGRQLLRPDRANRAWDDLRFKISQGHGSMEIF